MKKPIIDFTGAKVGIKESASNSWKMTWDSGETEVHSSAGAALKSVKAKGKMKAENGESSIIVIEWEPTTRIGRLVVNIISGS